MPDLGDWRWLHEVEGGPNDLVTTDVGRTVDGALHVKPLRRGAGAWLAPDEPAPEQ